MTRRFYTDPLAAAWQAKHFGMQFTADITYILRAIGDDWWQESNGGKYFIHPDSLHLLEPIEGDLCRFGSRIGRVVADLTFSSGHDYRIDTCSAHYFQLPDLKAILQRNGIAFMWPEQKP